MPDCLAANCRSINHNMPRSCVHVVAWGLKRCCLVFSLGSDIPCVWSYRVSLYYSLDPSAGEFIGVDQA